MNSHTPGPWAHYAAPQYALDHEDDSLFFTVGPSEYHTVAVIRPGNTDDGLPEQTPANARLIAASPDLLAALEEALPVIEEASRRLHEEADVEDSLMASARIELRAQLYDVIAKKVRAALARATNTETDPRT